MCCSIAPFSSFVLAALVWIAITALTHRPKEPPRKETTYDRQGRVISYGDH